MIWVLLYQIFVIWLAYKNSEWSNPTESWKIKHWLNGFVHVAVSLFIGWGLRWELAASNLLVTRVVFDTSMNVFRHLGLGYISPKPESWLDKQEKKLILWLVGLFSKKVIIENTVFWTAIGFRLFLLIVGFILLIV